MGATVKYYTRYISKPSKFKQLLFKNVQRNYWEEQYNHVFVKNFFIDNQRLELFPINKCTPYTFSCLTFIINNWIFTKNPIIPFCCQK